MESYYDTVLPGRVNVLIFMFRGASKVLGALPAGACLKITTSDISIDISENFVYKHARN